MKTRVFVTVDVECAEERNLGGKQMPAQGYDVRVWGRFKNQPHELGIGLLMRELEAEGLRGTFFTEVFGAHHFGRKGLGEAVGAMLARGHDVQLHTHPVQRVANWRTRGLMPAPDNIADYDVSRQAELLREGVEILEGCGVPKGKVMAFRAGNFGAENATWEAMARVGLVLSSNYNPCYFAKNCKMRSQKSAPGLFLADSGVWELPISNFREPGGGHRHMQITAVSLDEMKSYLLDAHARGIFEVTVVTHSFELCHIDEPEAHLGRVNTINLLRFRGLCRFLAKRSDIFAVDTAGALAQRLLQGSEAARPNGAGEYPLGLRRHKAKRLVEQAWKRVEAKLPLSFATLARP